MANSPAMRSQSCSLVRTSIAEWARVKDKPFPYLAVGEHLATCPTCLSWATAIAYEPTEHYVRALRLRLSWVIGILGQSVLRAWSGNQDLRFDIVCAQAPESVRQKMSKRLSQCESYNPQMKEQVSRIRELMPDPATGAPPGGLEPYALARYFLETALRMAPKSERLKLLDQLGIAEFTQAVVEQRAGRKEQADHHFEQAKGFYRQVIGRPKSGVRSRGGRPANTSKSGVRGPEAADISVGEKIDQVSARLSLAQVEYVQGGLSRPALEKTIELCLDAKRLVADLGLAEQEFTRILSNLLICYLRLFLDHGKTEAYDQARHLAEEACARPAVARVFLRRWVVNGEDPELAQLLASPRVKDITDGLKLDAQRVLRPGEIPGRESR